MGLGPPLLFLGGLAPRIFCLKIAGESRPIMILSLGNTISIGSSDKVNRLMKITFQNFGSILSILFLTCYL